MQTLCLIIMLIPPTMKTFANLLKIPIATDVTYKILKNCYYLCTSVLYSPETRKRNVILQAIMNGLMEKYFEGYFKALFTALASI